MKPDVMKPGALNLLKHPRKAAVAWRQYLLWGCPSFVLALLLGGWIQAQYSDLLDQQQHWRQQLAQQVREQNRQRALREHHQLQAQTQAVWQGIQAQQQRLQAVQTVLQHAAEQGMHLTRWQADGQRQWLQGHSPQAPAVSDLQSRLDHAWGQRWTLQSLTTGQPSEGVGWTLETPWLAASAPRGTP